MTQSAESGPVEFIHIAGYAVRVTSFRRDASGESMDLVTVARGTRDAEIMRELLTRGTLQLEISGEPPFAVRVEEADIRESGSGQSLITRFGVTFVRTQDSLEPEAATRSLEDRVAELERQVSNLTSLVREFSHRRG